MRTRDSREVFRPDLGLRVRMWLALALNAAFLAAVVWVAYQLLGVPGGWGFVLVFAVLVSAGATGLAAERRSPHVDPPARLTGIVSRLSLVADISTPATVVTPQEAPLSWTTALPGRRPSVHVTTGLLERLEDRELEAVIAHEISHIGNRDAALMTILAAPGVFVLRGLHVGMQRARGHLSGLLGVVMFACIFGLPALVSAGLSLIVSRHRELAADRGAALLTGSPATVAAALMRLSDGLRTIPRDDLRLVAAADVLYAVPTKPEHEIDPVMATHPPLAERIRRLEQLEARLQGG